MDARDSEIQLGLPEDEEAALNEIINFDYINCMRNDNNEELQISKEDPQPHTDWYRHLGYLIGREYGYNISNRFHSSLFAVRRLDLLHKLFTEESTTITSLSFNREGNYLVNGSNDDGTIAIWDWEMNKKFTDIQFIHPKQHTFQFYQLEWIFLRSDYFIVSSDSNGDVSILNAHTGDITKLISNPNHRHSFASHKSNPWGILIADDDCNLSSIDLRDSKITTFPSSNREDGCYIQLFTIDADPSNDYEFCVAGNMSCVNVYDRRTPSVCLHQMYPEHIGLNGFTFVDHVFYNHNGSEIVAAYSDEAVYLFDNTTEDKKRNYKHRYEGLMNAKNVSFFGPNSEFIVASSDDGNIFIWDKNSEALVRTIQGDETSGALKSHPYAPILASSGKDICIWTPSSEESTSTISGDNNF